MKQAVGMTDKGHVSIMEALDLDSAIELINRQAAGFGGNCDTSDLINCFRYLRNFCTSPDNQNAVIQKASVLESSTKILSTILKCNRHEALCLQIGLQFLGNLVVNNKTNQEKVWTTCGVFLRECLKFEIPKVQTCSSMILYNIFLGTPKFLNDVEEPLEDLAEMTLSEATSEFAVFILELLILKSDYVVNFYDKLKQEHRLIILEIIKNLVVDQNNQDLRPHIIKFFSDKFIVISDGILKTSEHNTRDLDPVETVKMLDLLVAFSSDDRLCYFDVIVKETCLLINCLMLLKSVHSLSKGKGNAFSMITKISEMDQVEKNETIQEHPAFGIKCCLIRLIGNLCWKNPENQDKVRELGGIPVLLDCCNIDGRNPFIIQWCILAIRNICENNVENQKVISSMSKEGKIDPARLREMGITLNTNSHEESICITPLK